MSAGNSFIERSLAGALLSALLFASPVAASDQIALPKADNDHKLLSSSIERSELRPASSDAFVPQVAGSQRKTPVSATDPFENRLDPDKNSASTTRAPAINPTNTIDRLSESVLNAHIFPASGRFKIMRSDSTIAVSTYRHPYGKELDMKIDALLVAREVMRCADPSIQFVKVYFFNEAEQSGYTLVSIDLDLVKHFNAGQLSNADVFDSLSLQHESLGISLKQLSEQSYEEIAAISQPGEGILQQERIDLVQQIERLKTRGSNVNSLETAYLLLEDAIRQNDDLGARAAYAFAIELLENARLKAGISSAK